jgi:hypothetical protein
MVGAAIRRIRICFHRMHLGPGDALKAHLRSLTNLRSRMLLKLPDGIADSLTRLGRGIGTL